MFFCEKLITMKKLFFFPSFLALCFAAISVAQSNGYYRVSFTDKNNSPYSIANPSDYLSARAIARRAQQGIAITAADLPVNPAYLSAVSTTGATLINTSKWFNSAVVSIHNASQYNQLSALSFVDTLEWLAPPTIKSAGADKFEMEMIPRALPSLMGESISAIDYGFGMNQATMISVDYLHDLGYQGQGVHIAVIDAGFNGTDVSPIFDSVWTSGRLLGYRDFANPGGNVFSAHNHGTMVFSIMGGNIPGQLVGTAPQASYWLLRSEVGATEYIVEEDHWIAAAEFADSAGVDIINSSLGYTEFYDMSQNHTYEDMDGNTTRITRGADFAASRGILVVNSAGNSGNAAWNYIGAPADGDSVFSIGAVDAFGNYASFSSKGPSWDGRIKPDVSAQGQGTAYGDPWGSVGIGNGTSFSSPVIAGAAACLWQAFPAFNNVQIMDAIRQSASQYANPDTLLGYGIPDFAAAATILGAIPPKQHPDQAEMLVRQEGREVLHIRLTGLAGNLQLSLLDVQGRTLRTAAYASTGEPLETSFSVQNLPEGVYLIRAVSSKGRAIARKILR